jgi:hypothetical protein
MLREVFRLLPLITAIWFVLFILVGASGVFLNDPFDLFMPLFAAFLWLVGGALALGLLASLFYWQRRMLRIICLSLVVITLPTFYVYGDDISFYSYFYWHKNQYEDVIARVNSSAECSPRNSEKLIWVVDCRSPRRIAFPMPGGITDNWVGIIYDPTGLVMQANQVPMSDIKDLKYAYVVGLFSGDMTSARHLFGPWYVCSFT